MNQTMVICGEKGIMEVDIQKMIQQTEVVEDVV
jgi:hypothetical protein